MQLTKLGGLCAALCGIGAFGCGDGLQCTEVVANGLTFDCRGAGEGVGVLLLHGFPERAKMFDELMRQLAAKGFRSVACDQRGYSPGASPDGLENYDYDLLRSDVFAIARAVGFQEFHLVGHDHGCLLGWYSVNSDEGRNSLLSYSGLSVPHPDAFSAGLYGPDADAAQQVASQYFSMFVLPNSSSIHNDFLYNHMGKSDNFTSAASFQKALWWYTGAMGVMAFPPQMTTEELLPLDAEMSYLRGVFGLNPSIPLAGVPQEVSRATGDIEIPALFVCGSGDTALLCTEPYAKATENFCKAGYTYLEVDCGHDVMACTADTETQKVIDGIIDHIVSASGGAVVTIFM